MSSAAWRRAPCTNTPASVSGGLPTATLAISVAVSMASQGPLLISTPPQRGRRNVERGTDRAVVGPVCAPRESTAPYMFRVPCSAFRVREPSPATSPYLLQLSDVGLIAVSQPKVPLERRSDAPPRRWGSSPVLAPPSHGRSPAPGSSCPTPARPKAR